MLTFYFSLMDTEGQRSRFEKIYRENAVLEAVKNLPVHYRDVFLLKYSLGLTNGEIGELLGLTVSGVKQRVVRGKELLRAELTEAGFGIPYAVQGHAASGSGDAGMPGAGTGKYPPVSHFRAV